MAKVRVRITEPNDQIIWMIIEAWDEDLVERVYEVYVRERWKWSRHAYEMTELAIEHGPYPPI
mgnify:CR=1 FL=1